MMNVEIKCILFCSIGFSTGFNLNLLRFRLVAKFANQMRQNTALKSIALCDKQINGYSRLKENCK